MRLPPSSSNIRSGVGTEFLPSRKTRKTFLWRGNLFSFILTLFQSGCSESGANQNMGKEIATQRKRFNILNLTEGEFGFNSMKKGPGSSQISSHFYNICWTFRKSKKICFSQWFWMILKEWRKSTNFLTFPPFVQSFHKWFSEFRSWHKTFDLFLFFLKDP